jgi:hypothetical protein
LYAAKVGNTYYREKKVGIKVEPAEKCIFGALFSTIVLTLIIGPFMLFSDIGGLTVENPVLNSDI